MLRRILLGAGALAALAVVARGAPARETAPEPFADFVEPDFPFFASILQAGDLGADFPLPNLSVRCLVLQLGGDSYACFDTDLLRVAAAWHGGFMSLGTMAQVSYREEGNKETALPRIQGRPIVATGMMPGWYAGSADFADPRPEGRHPGAMGRGPLPPEQARWRGVQLVGDRAVLSYEVGGTPVRETLSRVVHEGEVGFARTFETGSLDQPLTLVVAEIPDGRVVSVKPGLAVFVQPDDTATVVGVTGGPRGARLALEKGRFLTLRLPATRRPSRFQLVAWRGPVGRRGAISGMLTRPPPLPPATAAGASRWPEEVRTRGRLSPDSSEYVVDLLTLPVPNPWRRNVRVADLDFFRDGSAALVTFDGDVWLLSGIDRELRELRWKRFASGLYEPLSLQVVADEVYVYDRQGITRLRDLNGDREADLYESFSNGIVQSGESREFPLSMEEAPGGGFFASVGGAINGGYPMTPVATEGFRLGSPHAGSVLRVSAAGEVSTVATGFREPFIGVHPLTGMVTASDQQGHFVPSTPLFLVRAGAFHGVPATAHVAAPPAPAPPLAWIPHAVDRSSAGQSWVTDERMGLGAEALLHLSYARPGALRVLIDSSSAGVQGAVVPIPADHPAPILKGEIRPQDGQLYLAGFRIYGSNAPEVSGLTRLRHTGSVRTLPTAVRAGEQGVLIRFPAPLDPATATDPGRWRIERWDYVRTEKYGSPHLLADGSPGQERVPVGAAHLSPDGRTVLLVTARPRRVMQMSVAYELRAAGGAPVRNALYLTAAHLPELDLAAAGFGGVDWRDGVRRAEAARSALVRATSAASAGTGAELYARVGCAGCHSVDGSNEGRMGPTFRGLYGWTRPFADGSSQRAYEDYLRQSILHPSSQIVAGYEEGMPSYQGVLTDAEVESLVLYIRSLGTGRR